MKKKTGFDAQSWRKSGYLTVGEIKKWLKLYKYPDNALVLYQRIEDIYFKKHGWSKSSVKKPNGYYPVQAPKDEFVVAFSPIKYKGDKHLYLTAHY